MELNRENFIVRCKLDAAPPMEIADLRAWLLFKAHNSERVVVIQYISDFARLAQQHMSLGVRMSAFIEWGLQAALPPEGLDAGECAIAMQAWRNPKYWKYSARFRNGWATMMRRRKPTRR